MSANGQIIKEKDSYYVLRHKPTGLYVHELALDCGNYDLEEGSLLDNPDNQGYLGPFRMYPQHPTKDMIVSALDLPPDTDFDVVARQLDQEARKVIDWLNEHVDEIGGSLSEGNHEYSDFELMLVEVEYTVKDVQSMAAVAAV